MTSVFVFGTKVLPGQPFRQTEIYIHSADLKKSKVYQLVECCVLAAIYDDITFVKITAITLHNPVTQYLVILKYN